MADIRIKDLTTEVSSTATGDFFVIDGTTGTRKIPAFNPTFGGNATVTGTLTVNSTITANGPASGITVNGAGITMDTDPAGASASLRFVDGATPRFWIYKLTSDNNLYIRDMTNSRMQARFNPNSTSSTAITSFYSKVEIDATTASTTTSTGALVVGNGTSGGLGVGGAIYAGGAIFAGGNIQSNAVFAANNTTLYLRPQGATVSSGEAQLTTTGNFTLAGTLTSGNFIKSANTSAANDTEFTAFRADVGADGTLGAAVVAIGSLPSATGASRYGFITCSDNVDWRKLYIGGRPGLAASGGQVLIPSTASSTSTSSGALVVSGGVGVAGAIYAGGSLNISGTGGNTIAGNTTFSTGQIIVSNAFAPTSASAAGTTGSITWDNAYIYVCVATNTWKRVAISTW